MRIFAALCASGNPPPITIVSPTERSSFPILFRDRAIESWLRHIRGVHRVIFVGRDGDYREWRTLMARHYDRGKRGRVLQASVEWVNETVLLSGRRERFGCPYEKVCQQLMKLHVFELNITDNNVLIVDSDTVWGRDTTFVRRDGTATYATEYAGRNAAGCTGMDPTAVVDGLTNGTCPFQFCRRDGFENATGRRHIMHHMLFQRDVMAHLHATIRALWRANTFWEAVIKSWTAGNKGRWSEYELYFQWLTCHFPLRIHPLPTNASTFKRAAGDCSVAEMRRCRNRGVYLKACHRHRVGQAIGQCD